MALSKPKPLSGAEQRPLRVAVVLPTHWRYLMGGSQYQAKLLVEALHESGAVDVAYFCARTGEETESLDHAVTPTGPARALREYGHFWDYFSLQKALQEFEPDIIYQRVRCSLTGIVARYAKRRGIPMIWHVCVDTDVTVINARFSHWIRNPHRVLERALGEYGIRSADYVIVQTHDQAKLIRSNYGIEAHSVIPNFHPVPKDCDRKNTVMTVVWIANLKRVKRPEVFLEIASRLSDMEGVRFKIAGAKYTGRLDQREFEAKVSELPNTEYLGYLSQEEVNALLEDAHILVNTSVVEGLANTFIQAWMRRVPVLTLGVNPDNVLDSGELGKNCESVTDLADTLRHWLMRPDILHSMGERCRKRSIQFYSLNNVSRLADLIIQAGTRASSGHEKKRHQTSLKRVSRKVAKLFNQTDREKYFVSFPKSGRTWIRMFLNHYYFYVYPFCVVGRKQRVYKETVPSIKFTHGGHDDFGASSMSDIAHAVSETERARCIVLIRDPRDVLVSYFFHVTKRIPESGLRNNIRELEDIIRHQTLGFNRIIEFTNIWYGFASENPNALLVHYEEIQKNTEAEFIRILKFLGEAEVNPSSLHKAIQSTSFENMKKAERQSESKLPYLTSVNVDDNDSFKVRKGEVGGYASYVTDAQKEYMNEQMERLHPMLRNYYLGAQEKRELTYERRCVAD